MVRTVLENWTLGRRTKDLGKKNDNGRAFCLVNIDIWNGCTNLWKYTEIREIHVIVWTRSRLHSMSPWSHGPRNHMVLIPKRRISECLNWLKSKNHVHCWGSREWIISLHNLETYGYGLWSFRQFELSFRLHLHSKLLHLPQDQVMQPLAERVTSAAGHAEMDYLALDLPDASLSCPLRL